MTYREAYERILGRELPIDGENVINCFCPNHAEGDRNKSCSVNTVKGVWTCYVSDAGGGLAEAIVSLDPSVQIGEARRRIAALGLEAPPAAPKRKERDPIAPNIRDAYIRALNHRSDRKDYALKHLGWNPATLKRFEIGWHEKSSRYTIPIYDEKGDLRNLRMYDPDGSGTGKMISWETGYGGARLFPISSLKAQTIILCEGEKDTILMNQVLERFGPDDWVAITSTGGASSWGLGWSILFKNKDVYIIYDRDTAGSENAAKISRELVQHAREVKVVELDITEPKGADVTNYFQDSGKTWDDLKELIDRTPTFSPQTRRLIPKQEEDSTLYDVHLSQASHSQYVGKKLRMKVLVAGKDLSPYLLPSNLAFTCDGSLGKQCLACAMYRQNFAIEYRLNPSDHSAVELVGISEREQYALIKDRLKINKRCHIIEVEKRGDMNLEQVTLVPEIDFTDSDKEHVSRTAFVPHHGIRANRSYEAEGTLVRDPKRSHAIHYLPVMNTAQGSVDRFKMDDKKRELLRIFQLGADQSVAEKMEEIADDLSLNVTKIYGRNDLIKAIDLCYHSVVAWDFQGKRVVKGWGDILVLGDTRTGKTETIQELIYHYKLGEMSVGENTSFAGLVGGLKQGPDRRWQITWGRIPLNNRRLLVIDETSGLETATIGDMSGIRSNGIAELTKIETQRTEARTRLVWLSNPRDAKSMNQYGHGIEAVRHLIGRPEDIARFDFVVTAATNEVPMEVINTNDHPECAHVYTSDLCHTLLLWTWSRTAEQVVFTDEAVDLILALAIEQGKRYASDGGIPLVEGGNHRIKLAKLAVAAACRTFSTDDGERVVVLPEHAEYAAEFLDEIYAKPSLDYLGWSQTKLSKSQVDEKVIAEAEEWCKEHPEWAEVWLVDDLIRLEDFKNKFDLETKDVKSDIFRPLSKLRMIEKGRLSTYQPTPAFIQILKKVLANGAVAAAPSSSYDDQDIPF